jgi:hypothetical protein
MEEYFPCATSTKVKKNPVTVDLIDSFATLLADHDW